MKNLLLIISLVCAETFSASAQTESSEFAIKRHCKKIDQLNDYISFMANPQKANKMRIFYKEQAQKLFITDCERFKVIVEYKNGSKEEIWCDGVAMEVASLRNRTLRHRL